MKSLSPVRQAGRQYLCTAQHSSCAGREVASLAVPVPVRPGAARSQERRKEGRKEERKDSG